LINAGVCNNLDWWLSLFLQHLVLLVCFRHNAHHMLLSQTAPLAHSALSLAAAAAVAGLQSLQLHRRMPQLSRDLTTSTQQQQTGKSVGASDELLSQIKDKELLKTCGLIGGKWSEASNGATYDVSSRATGCCTRLAWVGRSKRCMPALINTSLHAALINTSFHAWSN
jgi:hypothetical protein